MSTEQKRPAQPVENDQPYWGIFDAVSDGLIIQDLETQRVVEANTAAAAMHGYSRAEFIGLPATRYMRSESLRLFTESLQVIQSGGMFESPATHVHRNGSPFYVEVRRTAFTYRSQPCMLSIVHDISKQVRAEQLLRQQAEARAREQSTLLDISHTLASTLELKPDLILDELRAIIRYRRAALFVLEDSALVAVSVRGGRQPEGGLPYRIRLDGGEIVAAEGSLVGDGLVPAGCYRNRDHYSPQLKAGTMPGEALLPLFDPQTSGGLLISLPPAAAERFLATAATQGCYAVPVGEVLERREHPVEIV